MISFKTLKNDIENERELAWKFLNAGDLKTAQGSAALLRLYQELERIKTHFEKALLEKTEKGNGPNETAVLSAIENIFKAGEELDFFLDGFLYFRNHPETFADTPFARNLRQLFLMTSAHLEAARGNADAFKKLVSDTDLSLQADRFSFIPLYEAIRNQHLEIIDCYQGKTIIPEVLDRQTGRDLQIVLDVFKKNFKNEKHKDLIIALKKIGVDFNRTWSGKCCIAALFLNYDRDKSLYCKTTLDDFKEKCELAEALLQEGEVDINRLHSSGWVMARTFVHWLVFQFESPDREGSNYHPDQQERDKYWSAALSYFLPKVDLKVTDAEQRTPMMLAQEIQKASHVARASIPFNLIKAEALRRVSVYKAAQGVTNTSEGVQSAQSTSSSTLMLSSAAAALINFTASSFASSSASSVSSVSVASGNLPKQNS